jgi:hypothetical protein
LDADEDLRTKGIVVPHVTMPGTRVASLSWFHYLNQKLVITVGGTAHCLATPAYRVEKFSDGVLFQLTRDPFDAKDAKHCDAREQAMRHLGIGNWE